jgi:hypothetical protein
MARYLVTSIFQVRKLISPRHGVWVPNAPALCFSSLLLWSPPSALVQKRRVRFGSTRDLSTTLLQTSGEVPSPRFGPASACIGTVLFKVLLIWGGATIFDQSTGMPEGPYDNSLYLLNLGTLDPLISKPILAD